MNNKSKFRPYPIKSRAKGLGTKMLVANEPPSNIRTLKKGDGKKYPQPGIFKDETPESMVGKIVKLAFPAIAPDGSPGLEHLWVITTGILDGQLLGIVDNEPHLFCQYKYGDEIVFKVEDIEVVNDSSIMLSGQN